VLILSVHGQLDKMFLKIVPGIVGGVHF